MRLWPFRRNQTNVNNQLPKEVKDYYQAENRDRRGVAWLLGLATVVVTVLLAFGLFFGGRFVYRKIAGRNNPDVATTQQPETSSQNSDPGQNQGSNNNGNDDKQNNKSTGDQEEPAPADNTDNSNEDEETSNRENPEELADTGPGNIVALFAGATLVGYVVHRKLSL